MDAHLRIARPTDNLQKVGDMYRKGLGFEVLGGFDGHGEFDGVMLGYPGGTYHLEFTHQRGHEVGRSPTKDHLLVFYIPDTAAWKDASDRMLSAGFVSVPAYNPYWDRLGATFEDCDGYRVVLQNTAWNR